MAEITNQEFHPSELESLQHGEAQDFTFLLRVLDYDPSKTVQDHVTLKAVEPRLQRAVDSDTTTVYTVRRQPDCPILATGTLSRAEILTGKGARMWVDDVVTRPDWQGKGMFTQIMNAMEEKAALSAD